MLDRNVGFSPAWFGALGYHLWFLGFLFSFSILGLPVSGMRYGGLVMIADWGKAPLLTGHTFGPEGGLLVTIMLLVTVAIFWQRGRRAERRVGPPHT